MSNLKTQNEALADLILGILIFGILVVFVGLFVAPDKAAFVLLKNFVTFDLSISFSPFILMMNNL